MCVEFPGQATHGCESLDASDWSCHVPAAHGVQEVVSSCRATYPLSQGAHTEDEFADRTAEAVPGRHATQDEALMAAA